MLREHSVVKFIIKVKVAGDISGFLSPSITCNVMSELKGGHSECVRSAEVTTHSKGPFVV